MLKPNSSQALAVQTRWQPPSGGCVLKPEIPVAIEQKIVQPPSGGCVLKLRIFHRTFTLLIAATFGWLCVETNVYWEIDKFFGAATFGWLCVETLPLNCALSGITSSHLRVAVC